MAANSLAPRSVTQQTVKAFARLDSRLKLLVDERALQRPPLKFIRKLVRQVSFATASRTRTTRVANV